jgi:hypothetical protein
MIISDCHKSSVTLCYASTMALKKLMVQSINWASASTLDMYSCMHAWFALVMIKIGQSCREYRIYARIQARASISFLALESKLQNETGVLVNGTSMLDSWPHQCMQCHAGRIPIIQIFTMHACTCMGRPLTSRFMGCERHKKASM